MHSRVSVVSLLAVCGLHCAVIDGTMDARLASDATEDSQRDGFAIVMDGTSLSRRRCPEGSLLSYENFGAPFFSNYCTGCHSSRLIGPMARRGAPAIFNFDSLAEIQRNSSRIYDSAADTQTRMPPLSGPSHELRQVLGDWLACGARGSEPPPVVLEPYDASVQLDGACARPTPPTMRMTPPACSAQIAECVRACTDRTGGCQVTCSAASASCNSCYNQQKAVCLDRVCGLTFAVDRCCRAQCATEGDDAGSCIARRCVSDGVAFLYCVQARGEECLGTDGLETRVCF